MDINEIYKRVKYLADKAGLDSYISPDEFNQMFNGASVRHFNRLYLQYASTQRISDSLSKFVTDPTPLEPDADGKVEMPEDLIHITSITASYKDTQKQVKRVEADRVANNLSSTYDAPSNEFPIYVQYKGYMQFYPKTVFGVNLTYLKRPTDVKWAYTLPEGTRRPLYDADSSVQTEWADVDIDSIIYELLKDYAMNAKDGELENYTQLQSKQQA